ncbi:MAG: hypothetical protein J6J44_02995 [Lachnospiraceae bacterium]|nr:hypothetical protein [Lachnospiraceae bacterium]
MRVKKVVMLGACILGMYSLVGCSGENQEQEKKTPINHETNNEVENEAVQEENENLKYMTEPREEILSDELSSTRIQFGGEILEFPFTVQDLLDKGAVIYDDYKETGLIESFEYVDFKLNDVIGTFHCENQSDTERITLNKCIVTGGAARNEGIFFAKGLTKGMTLDALTEKWGTPYKEEDGIHGQNIFDYLSLYYMVEPYIDEQGDVWLSYSTHYEVVIELETGEIWKIELHNAKEN